ncbi:MAG: CDP-alcohol phosphatidyltransferase family protein [Candidatus Heimdallarchaeota archaeon]|nr:MAG: CDP-alcohol phosphatidyltransferase family protein [Candidatus Heimdallarchaeota archaeon]
MSSLNKFTLLAFFLTCLNAICGIVGILFSFFFSADSPIWYLPMQLLIFGAIFDYLDGRVAKKAPMPSALGAYSDSVADVISFAILPGVMVLNSLSENSTLESQEIFVLVVAGIYSLCGWARLIRFATHPTDIHFDGLPSPAAALFIGSSALLATQQEMHWFFWTNGLPLTLITIVISILMILTINYPTPKRGKTPDMVAICIAGVVVITFVFFPFYGTLSAVLFIAILYTAFGPLYLRKTKK